MLRELGIKPNYAELARKYNCDYRTIKKYNEGYEGKAKMRERYSHLMKYEEEIKEKLNLPGSNIQATYQYMKEKYNVAKIDLFNAHIYVDFSVMDCVNANIMQISGIL